MLVDPPVVEKDSILSGSVQPEVYSVVPGGAQYCAATSFTDNAINPITASSGKKFLMIPVVDK
jgi:hypothetical protein